MKTLVLVAALFGSVAAQASECVSHQSVEEIAIELAANKSGFLSACEIRQVVAVEQRHAELTGSNCTAGGPVKLVEMKVLGGSKQGATQLLHSEVTVVNPGAGQPVDSYNVTGEMLADGNGDCVVTSVKLAPMSNGR